MSKTMPLRPRLSEQAYALSQTGVYVFTVPSDANKHTVAQAVTAQFDVTVAEVNISVLKGKAKRTLSKKGRRQLQGRTSDVKKAFVKLAEGQKLPIFDAVEEEEAKAEAAQEQIEKAAAKQDAKEAKKAKKESK